MPQPEMRPDDIFHVIGFTREDILSGSHMALMQRLVSPDAPRSGVKNLVEVYSFDPFESDDDEGFEQRYGKHFLTVYFYNETALTLSKQYGIQSPAVIEKTTRAELPQGLGTSICLQAFTTF